MSDPNYQSSNEGRKIVVFEIKDSWKSSTHLKMIIQVEENKPIINLNGFSLVDRKYYYY